MAKIRGIQTGSTTLRATYQGITSSNVTITVQSATPVLTFTATSSTLTYTGSSQVIGTVFYSGDGTVSYAIVKATSQPDVPTSGWTDVAINSNLWTSVTGGKQLNISATDAGTHYVFLKSAAGTNYVALSGRSSGSKVINKASQNAPTVTASNATYHGTATCSASGGGGHGTLYYKSDPNNGTNYGTATTTAPTRTDIGSTKVIAYWGGDSNYNASSNSTAVSITVSKFTPTISFTSNDNNQTFSRVYNGSALYVKATVSGATQSGSATPKGTIYYGTSSGATTYSVTYTGTAVNLSSVSVTDYNNGSGNSKTVYAYFVPDSSCNGVYNNSGNKSQTITISGKADQAAPTASGQTVTFPDTATGSATGGGGHGSKTFKADTNGGTNYGTATTTTPTRSTYGTTTFVAYWAGDGNYNASPNSSQASLVVNKREVQVNAPTFASGTLTYDGSAKTVASGGSCGTGGTMYYYISTSSTPPTVTSGSAPGTGWTTSSANPQVVQATAAGTYYVWYYCYVSDTTNNKSTSSGNQINTVYQISGSKAIGKRNVTITAPTNTNRTYNTSAQTIMSAGSATTGGLVYYSTSNDTFNSSTWVSAIPYTQKTNAGTYTLYWYCYVSDTGNNQDDSGDSYVINSKYSISATINKATPPNPVCTAGSKATYDTTAVYAKVSISSKCTTPSTLNRPSGSIYYGATSGATTYSVAPSTTAVSLASMGRTNVGSTDIYVFFSPTDTSNYNNSGVVTTVASVIGKATTQAPVLTSAGTSIYNGTTYYAKASVLAKCSNPSTLNTPAGKIYYGATSGAETYNITASTTAASLTSMSRTNVGTTTIYAFFKPNDTTNYESSSVVSTTVAIASKATPTFNLLTSTGNTTYPTAATIEGKGSVAGTVYWGTSSSTSGMTSTKGVSANTNTNLTNQSVAGTKTVYAYFVPTDSTNYNSVGSSTLAASTLGVTVAKRDVGITAPTTTARTYNGSNQTIFGAASATSGGVVYYSTTNVAFNSSTWVTTIPYTQKSTAGTYTLYWYCYVSDTSNNKDLSTDSHVINSKYTASVTIAKATPAVPNLTAGGNSVYTGTTYYAFASVAAKCTTPNTLATPAGKIYYGGSAGSTSYNITASTIAASLSQMGRSSVGTTTIYAFFRPDDTTNYNDSATTATTTVKISNKADTAVPVLTSGVKDTYDGTAVYATAKNGTGNPAGKVYYSSVSGGTTYNVTAATTDTSLTSMGRTVPGTTTIYAFFRPNDTTNYNDSTVVTTTAKVTNKYTPVLTLSGTDRVFNNSDLYASVSSLTKPASGKALSGTIYYGTTSGATTYSKAYSAGATLPSVSVKYYNDGVNNSIAVYAHFVPDSTCNDVYNTTAVTDKTLTITGKANTTKPVLTSGIKETYDGSYVYAQAANAAANPAGTIKYGSASNSTAASFLISVAAGNTTAYNMTETPRSTVGSRTIYAYFAPTDASNYNNSTYASTKAWVKNRATGTTTYSTQASSLWCTVAATASSTTDALKGAKIAPASATTNGGTVTYAITVKDASNNTVSGWTVSTKGTTISIPSGTQAGTYTVTITATAPSSTNYHSSLSTSSTTVAVNAVELSSITLTLKSTTISCNTSTSVSSLIAQYNNAATKNITSMIGSASTDNPKVNSSDTTIATVLVS